MGFAPLAWGALVPLLLIIKNAEPKRASLYGLICGMVFYTLLLYWIVIVLGKYGYLPLWISIPALLLLAFYLSLYIAAFAGICSWAMKRTQVLIIAPPLWVALDYLRGLLFTGFPWQDLGYSQFKFPVIIQLADLFGHHALTFLILVANCIIFSACSLFIERRNEPAATNHRRAILIGLIILTAFMGYNLVRFNQFADKLESAESISVAVVQGNVPQDKKWVPEFQRKTLNDYISLSESALKQETVDLLIWPETALPFYPLESHYYPELLKRLLNRQKVNLLTGAPHRQTAPSLTKRDFYNSAFMINSSGITGRYDKQHLVPFGEYVPIRKFLPFLAPLVQTIGDFSAGQTPSLLAGNNALVGTLICYESIFPDLARKQAADGANILVNITNDAWFGRSSAPEQHFSMAVFRAVENRRSLARAANTGISGFIDPLGRITQKSPLFEALYLVDRLPLMDDSTFFTRIGHYFAPLCLMALLVLIIILARKKIVSHN